MKAQVVKTVYAAFRQEAQRAPNPLHYLYKLPPTPEALKQQCHSLYQILYADEPPEVSPHPEAVFQSLAAQTACRLHAGRALAPPANQLSLGDGSMANMSQMMNMFGQMMQHVMRATRSDCNLEMRQPKSLAEGAEGERQIPAQANGNGRMLADDPCPPQGSNRANIRRQNAIEDLEPLLDRPQDALPSKWKEPGSSPHPSRAIPSPPTLGSALTVPSAIAAEPPPMATPPRVSTCAVNANDSQARQSEVADAAKAVQDAYDKKQKAAAGKATKERERVIAQTMAEDLATARAKKATKDDKGMEVKTEHAMKGEQGTKVKTSASATLDTPLVNREHEHGGLDGETPPPKPKKPKTKSGPEYEQYRKEMTMSMVYNMLKPRMGHEDALVKAEMAGEKNIREGLCFKNKISLVVVRFCVSLLTRIRTYIHDIYTKHDQGAEGKL